MGFMFSGLFWGVVVILLGLTIILNVVLGVRIPLLRIVIGLILIYWGISLLAGTSFRLRVRNSAVFSSTRVAAAEPAKEYNVIFGKGEIDLSGVTLRPGENRTEINTVFGSSEVRLSDSIPTKLVVSAAFAGARMPDGNTIAFGEYTWRSPGFREDSGYLLVKASVVFGGLELKTR